VAEALRRLERSLAALVDDLSHADTEVNVAGVRNPATALGRVCDAYLGIDNTDDDASGAAQAVLGVVGAPAHVIARAREVNEAKAALKQCCGPLQERRISSVVKDEDGRDIVKPMPLVRLILRDVGRPRLNLLAAYRKIQVLEKRPKKVGYVKARTRSVYRRTREELLALLDESSRLGAEEDRARLRKLPRDEGTLVWVEPYQENTRANVTYATGDGRGRVRLQITAQLPVLYPLGRSKVLPEVEFPIDGPRRSEAARRRPARIEEEAYLTTMPVHRYLKHGAPVKRASARTASRG
jgi:hypothetical protein